MKSASKTVDMTSGPMLNKIILFIIPLILTRLLQECFQSADTAVIGRCVGDLALGAVGASSSIIAIVFWIAAGIGSGVSVVIAQDIGSHNDGEVVKGVHSALLLGLIIGAAMTVIGLALSRWALTALGTAEEILDDAVLYFCVVLLDIPAQMVYQVAAAALRAAGDTTKPVMFLAISGAANVVLNVFSVVVLHMGVLGVALATTVTQYLSAVLILIYMARRTDALKFEVSKLKMSGAKVKAMLGIGVPASVQGILFSISDIAIATAINKMGPLAMSGNSVAFNIDGYVFLSMESLTQACMVFSGQNVGAKLYDRSKKAIRECIGISTVLGLVVGALAFIFRRQLAGLFLPDSPEAVEHAIGRLSIVTTTCFIYGILDCISAGLRSYNSSLLPAVISVVGISGFRVCWVLFFFPTHMDMFSLYLCYPLAWILCLIPELIALVVIIRRRVRENSVTA